MGRGHEERYLCVLGIDTADGFAAKIGEEQVVLRIRVYAIDDVRSAWRRAKRLPPRIVGPSIEIDAADLNGLGVVEPDLAIDLAVGRSDHRLLGRVVEHLLRQRMQLEFAGYGVEPRE